MAKNVLITGANTGIGLETARQLAAIRLPDGQPQYTIYLACRDQAKAQSAIDDILASSKQEPPPHLEFHKLDLSNLESVRSSAREFLEKDIPLHVLILNAGIANMGAKTAQGYEPMFGVNHLGHFLLTKLLVPRLKESAPSRIVVVSSDVHRMVKMKRVEIENLPTVEHPGQLAALHGYGVSKLCNIWFTNELARQLEGSGVVINSLHPGAVRTELNRDMSALVTVLLWPIKWLFFLSAKAGAYTTVYLASSPKVEGVTGKYFAKCKEVAPEPFALDVESEKKLWDLSEKLVEGFSL